MTNKIKTGGLHQNILSWSLYSWYVHMLFKYKKGKHLNVYIKRLTVIPAVILAQWHTQCNIHRKCNTYTFLKQSHSYIKLDPPPLLSPNEYVLYNPLGTKPFTPSSICMTQFLTVSTKSLTPLPSCWDTLPKVQTVWPPSYRSLPLWKYLHAGILRHHTWCDNYILIKLHHNLCLCYIHNKLQNKFGVLIVCGHAARNITHLWTIILIKFHTKNKINLHALRLVQMYIFSS